MDMIEIGDFLKDIPKVPTLNPKEAVETICIHMVEVRILLFCNRQPYLKREKHHQCITIEDAEAVVAQMLTSGDSLRVSKSKITECIKRLMYHPDLQIDMNAAFYKHQYALNLRNGVYDIKTQKLRERRADDVFDYILDFDYKPNCKLERTTAFRKFIETSVQMKNLPCLLRSTAYALSSLTEGRVAVLLLGEGSTGKSTYLDFIKSVVSDELISTVSFYDMAKETKKSAYIGKRINISRENNQKPMKDEDGFKSLVSCEDTNGRFLFKDSQTIHSHAKFIFASNHDLVFANPDDAVYDRLVVIRFTQKIPLEQRDLKLKADMIKEKDIIMSMAIDTLKDLIKSKYDFQMSDDGFSYIRRKRFQLHTDADFLSEKTITDPNRHISHVALYEAYKQWCKQNGLDAIGRNTFYSRVYDYYPSIRDGKIHSLNSFIGIRFRTATD